MQQPVPHTFQLTEKQRFWLFFTLCIGAFMSHFTAGVVNVSLPYLGSAFHTDLYSIQWITTAYLLVIAALLPIMGKLGDRYGHGFIHNMGYVLFTLSSVLIVLSSHVYVLICFRILQAIGAAMFQATNIALIRCYYPKDQRGRALGIMSAVVALGAMTGPPAGGVIAAWLSWQWLFLIHLPVAVAAVVLASRFIPAQRLSHQSPFVDRISSILFMLVIAAGIYSLSSGHAQGWLSPSVIAAYVIGFVALFLFLLRERRQTAPLLPMPMLRIPSIITGLLISTVSFVLINSVLVTMPFYLAHTTTYSPFAIGLIMTAYPVLFALASPFAGRMSDHTNPQLLMCIALGCMMIALVILSFFLHELTLLGLIVVLSLMGLGMGGLAAPNNGYIMRTVPVEYAGSIGGMIALTRNVGMVIGAALGLGMMIGHGGHVDLSSVFQINIGICLIGLTALGVGDRLDRRRRTLSYNRRNHHAEH